MSIIRRPTPFIDLLGMREAFDRLFDERFVRPLWLTNGERELAPALDVYTTPEAVVAKAALPGVKPEDVEITIADDLVTIAGSFKEEQEKTEAGYVHKELSRGAFRRTFTVPAAVKAEDAKAVFKDGLLTLTVPRAEEAKPRHVKVEAS
jgi:HSP20 family protein